MGVPCGRFAAGAGRIASLEPSWLYVPSSASMTCVRSGVATLCFCRFGDRDLARAAGGERSRRRAGGSAGGERSRAGDRDRDRDDASS